MNKLALLHLPEHSKISTYRYVIFSFLLMTSVHTQANVSNINYFQRAFMQCENIMQATWPDTRLALHTLQRRQAKYQVYRQQGLYYYNLNYLKKQSYHSALRGTQNYAEMLKYCDQSLPKKIKQAVNQLEYALTVADSLLKKQNSLENKHNKQALNQAKQAINQYCATYVRRNLTPHIDIDTAKQRDRDYTRYKQTKSQALALSPQVLHKIHQSIYRDSEHKKISQKQQSIQAWFEYCENVFAQHQAIGLKKPKAVEPILTEKTPAQKPTEEDNDKQNTKTNPIPEKIENATKPASILTRIRQRNDQRVVHTKTKATDKQQQKTPTTKEIKAVVDSKQASSVIDTVIDDVVDEEGVSINYEAQEFADLMDIVIKLSASRTNVLRAEERIPEYTDNDDEPELAAQWMYESGDGEKCRIYIFKKHALQSKRDLKEPCP